MMIQAKHSSSGYRFWVLAGKNPEQQGKILRGRVRP